MVLQPLSYFLLENHICLSRGVPVAGAIWQAAMRIVEGVGDLVRRTGDGRTGWVFGGRAIKRLGDIVCGLYCAKRDDECGFLGGASKPRSTVCQWFGLKITRTICQWFSLKTTRMVCQWFGLKTIRTVSPGLASKSVATSFLVWATKLAVTIW
jgi:hypothetical protein